MCQKPAESDISGVTAVFFFSKHLLRHYVSSTTFTTHSVCGSPTEQPLTSIPPTDRLYERRCREDCIRIRRSIDRKVFHGEVWRIVQPQNTELKAYLITQDMWLSITLALTSSFTHCSVSTITTGVLSRRGHRQRTIHNGELQITHSTTLCVRLALALCGSDRRTGPLTRKAKIKP